MRRLAPIVEESIDRGTEWAVFEPNDEPVCAAVNSKAYMDLEPRLRDALTVGRPISDE